MFRSMGNKKLVLADLDMILRANHRIASSADAILIYRTSMRFVFLKRCCLISYSWWMELLMSLWPQMPCACGPSLSTQNSGVGPTLS